MSRFERWNFWLSSSLTAVSGIGLLWTKYFLQSEDPWAVINHPWQPVFLKAHILAAPFLVFALGLIAKRHIWEHFLAGNSEGRLSGVVTILVTAPMVLSGYLIQLITHVGWLRAMAVAHIVLGFLFATGAALHQLFVRRHARAREEMIGEANGGHERPPAPRQAAMVRGN